MASSDLPPTPPAGADASTGIQTSPESSSIPLPPPPPPVPAMSVERFTSLRRGLDGVLVALVLAFAFLVASFPATNSDFFRHLATGRLLAHGDYHFGVDPFTYTSGDVYWVDHSWLYALAVYALYQLPAIGGALVVIAKALLVAALAEVLLRIGRRPGQSLWIPAVLTALAILTLSPRLYLQPVCLSYLFLVLTLWLLTAARPENGQRLWWLLPPLCVLWVNCDGWFFLGPLTIALFLVGELLQRAYPPPGEVRSEAGRGRAGMLALVLIVSLAACLLNPHHVHVFALPPEFGLSPAADLLADVAQFRALFLSPLRGDYYEPRLGLSVAGMAYWPLVLLGVVSFAFEFDRAPRWRLPVWSGFLLLSLYSTRIIPFFAIVAGPITALNGLDYAARRLGREPLLTTGWRRWSLGGRVLTIVVALGLLVATVPGWLQARPYETHRVGWGVRVDPSLEQAARQIRAWREAGRLPAEAHWFSLHHEVANYLAWFAPGERAFFDQRIPEFREAAEDYMTVRQSLGRMIPDRDAPAEAADAGGPAVAQKELEKVLRRRGVHFWVLDQSQMQKAEQVAPWMLFTEPRQWKLCYLHGRIAIFSWDDPAAKGGPKAVPDRLDLRRVAFGAEAEQAPPQGPDIVLPPRRWWEVWWRPQPPAPLDDDTARLHALRFEAMQPQFIYRHARAWQGAVAAMTIVDALPQGPLPNSLLGLSLHWSQTYADLTPAEGQAPARPPDRQRDRDAMFAQQVFVRSQDAGPLDSLYLGIRAARRALAANPEDAEAYLQLGWTYTRLQEATREGRLTQAAPSLADVRRTQIVSAYQNCLRCQPHPRSAAKAHEALYSAFQRRYWDLAAFHLRQLRETMQAIGPSSGESPERFTQSLEAMSRQLMPLEEEVKRRQDQYEVGAANKPVLEKVRIALEKGLAETALTTLEQAAPGELSGLKDVSTISQMMALFLDMGRLDKAADLLVPEPDMADKPVPLHYLEFYVRLTAARGDYAEADRQLAGALAQLAAGTGGRASGTRVGDQVAEQIGRALLGGGQGLAGAPRCPVPHPKIASDFWVRRWSLDALETSLLDGQQRIDWSLLRGWLALEAGRCAEARQQLEIVRDTVVPPEQWIPAVNRLDALLNPAELQMLQQLPSRQNGARELSRYYLKELDVSQR